MSRKFVAACIQTNAAPDIAVNLERLTPMIEKARNKGADFIALPENCTIMGAPRDKLFASSPPEDKNPAVDFFAQTAKRIGAWILAGSVPVATGHDRLANRSLLFAPSGEIAARYDKIHMFDAILSDSEKYRESDNYRSGANAVTAAMPWAKIGLTICYDLRFPHLHRALAKAGAEVLTVPAAFAATTGKLHWHVLNRARAIETGCFVIAPAQCGIHDNGRETYGHSLIIAPNGEILAEAGDSPGIILSEIDLAKVEQARQMLPCLSHDRAFEQPCMGINPNIHAAAE